MLTLSVDLTVFLCVDVQGELHINEDLDVFEITKDRITRRRWLVPDRSWGFW